LRPMTELERHSREDLPLDECKVAGETGRNKS